MEWEGMSNKAILKEMGDRVRRQRLNQDVTQTGLAEKAGVARSVVQKLERGDACKMDGFIKILRALGALGALDSLLPDPGVSPIQLLRRQRKERQRASGGR